MKTLLASACMAFALATSRRSDMRTSVWMLKSHSCTSGSRPAATETGQLHLTLPHTPFIDCNMAGGFGTTKRNVAGPIRPWELRSFELSESGTQMIRSAGPVRDKASTPRLRAGREFGLTAGVQGMRSFSCFRAHGESDGVEAPPPDAPIVRAVLTIRYEAQG